jgi:fructokinase
MSLSENTYPVVCFGEILWDMLPGEMLPGGAPMNVAYHCKKLGVEPALITKVGHDEDGKKLIQSMEENGISTDFFQMDFTLHTGLVKATIDVNNEVSYDILKPVAWDDIAWDDAFEKLMEKGKYFVFGSLASRSERSRGTLYRLLEMAKYRVLDINLRAPHYTRAIVEHLLTGLHLLKINLAELELITGWFSGYRDERDRIKSLQDRCHTPNIILTRGGDGSLFCVDGKIYEHPGYKVEMADTIGSGDAFLAGMLARLYQGASPGEALAFASAMGAFVASRAGPCPSYDISEITRLVKTSGAAIH